MNRDAISDQLAAARYEMLIFIERPAGRPRTMSAAVGGWLLVNTTCNEPGWIRNWPPARSFTKAEVSTANTAGSKLVTLPLTLAMTNRNSCRC